MKRGRSRRFLANGISVALATLLCGCSGPRRGYAPFFEEPKRYSRVAVAYMDIQTVGDPTDSKHAFTRAERDEAMRKAIHQQVIDVIRDRRFELVPAPPMVRLTPEDPKAVYGDVWESIHAQVELRGFEFRKQEDPYSALVYFNAAAAITPANDADAWLILSSRAGFEDSVERAHRIRDTIIFSPLLVLGAALLPGAMLGGGVGFESEKDADIKPYSPNWIRHCFALIDPRTGQILWSNWQLFDGDNARWTGTLKSTVESMFEGFPDAQ